MVEGLAVVANGTPNMTVLVQPGSGRVTTGTYPSSYGYLISHDTTAGESVTISTAAASPRIDYIVAYVDKGVAGSLLVGNVNNTNNVLKFAAVAGTPSGSPVVPTVSQIQTAIGAANPYIILAQVAVAASVTSITNTNITDLRSLISARRLNLSSQADTTNTTQPTTIVQAGWGQILGNGTAGMTKAITFPTPVTQVLSLNISFLGYKSGGTSAADITQFNTKIGTGAFIESTNITTTGFTAAFSNTATFGAAYHGYSWYITAI